MLNAEQAELIGINIQIDVDITKFLGVLGQSADAIDNIVDIMQISNKDTGLYQRENMISNLEKIIVALKEKDGVTLEANKGG